MNGRKLVQNPASERNKPVYTSNSSVRNRPKKGRKWTSKSEVKFLLAGTFCSYMYFPRPTSTEMKRVATILQLHAHPAGVVRFCSYMYFPRYIQVHPGNALDSHIQVHPGNALDSHIQVHPGNALDSHIQVMPWTATSRYIQVMPWTATSR
jgi:hypothetical protein